MTEPLDPGEAKPAFPPNAAAFPVVADHELIRLIGSGSSGQVWLARGTLGSYRAIKIVYENTFRHRRPFEREFNGVLKFEPISRLHEGLVDILHVGRNDKAGYFYCVMELADDANDQSPIDPATYEPRTLAHVMFARKRLPIGECLQFGTTIAGSLAFLHKHGLIHRDIKPSNIIFVDGAPKLADIGLVAEMSEARSYVGTEGFIPPEGPGTVQADIYSFGKVLYEISTGKDRHDYPELPIIEDPAAQRDLIQFNKIILNACRPEPRRRFKSAEELLEALREFQLTGEAPSKEKIRKRIVGTVGIAGLVIAISFITLLVWRIIWILRHTE